MMNRLLLGALAALLVVPAHAGELRDRIRADSVQDTAKHRPTPPNPENVAGTPSEADVGDADSFGRGVKYLGFAQSEFVAVSPDCTGQPAGTCVTPVSTTEEASVTYFGESAVVRLPGRAAKSLLCFALTPQASILYSNQTSEVAYISGVVGAQWRIESPVLEDPSLINPVTGMPFDGVIRSGTTLEQLWRSALPGQGESVSPAHTRSCISGHLSRRSLMGMGLTEQQARDVFRKPITIRFGASARAMNAQVFSGYGVRIYGD